MNFDFLATLHGLLFSYVTDAFPFFVAHVLLGMLVWRTLREIDTETDGLVQWDPAKFVNQGSCADLLSQFVDESRSAGEKGIVTPISEFSDRIDARVLSLEESVQNRSNFFVVIGIAGTFFALFRFAQNVVPGAQDALDVRVITDLLRASLANAFPVGFAGLILTVIAYFIAQARIDRLRDAVGRATQRALKMRGQGIRDIAQSLQKVLHEELTPLRDFDIALGDKLQPVMQQFRMQLAQSADLLAEKAAPLGEAARSLNESTAVLSRSMDGLANAAEGLPAALEGVQSLQQQTTNAVASLEKTLSGSARDLKVAADFVLNAGLQLEASGRTINEATASELGLIGNEAGKALELLTARVQAMAEMPEKLVNEYRAQFSALTERLGQEWSSSAGKLLAGLESHHIEALHSMRQEAVDTAAAMEAAARHVRESAESIDLLLNRGMRIVADSTVERLEPHLTRIDAAMTGHIPALEQGLGNAAAATALIGNETQRILEQLRTTAESLEALCRDLESSASQNALPSLQPLLAALEQISAKLDRESSLPERIGSWFRRGKEHRAS